MNIKLLRQVVDHISAHPETWDQRYFHEERSCGTTHCVAGWVQVFVNKAKKKALRYIPQHIQREAAMTYCSGVMASSIAVYAQQELGLTWPQAGYLFSTPRTLPEIKAFLAEQELAAQQPHDAND